MKNILVVLFFSLLFIIIYLSFSNKSIEYRGIDFDLRNDELGVMLFDGGAGQFSIVEAFQKDDMYLIKMYEYQGRRTFWVSMEEGEMSDVDSSNFKFSSFNEIDTQSLLDR